ncbi:MAG: helix-turn-helix transcriptional regulator [Rhodoferax sp.]|nr:helix-turn-helix transcriptional regulator [Rhodoferax sp.]
MPTSIYHPRYQALRRAMELARKTAGLTQVQMAEKLGVGQSYVSKIERGESYVDVMTLVDWYAACELRPGQALDQLLQVTPDDSQTA